jgi:ABC-type Zn uptake system ZnuABC Zn-binding protein ZnuA
VELMLSSDLGCPHDYVLTTEDRVKLEQADVLVVNGLGLEDFLGDLPRKANPKVAVIDSSAGVPDLIPLHEHEHKGHKHGGMNPHLFAGPRMAARLARNVAAELGRIDPGCAAAYNENARAYASRLEKLADDFAAAGKAFRSRKIVTQHAVFDYLARDAGLEIVAVVEDTPGQAPSAAEMLEIVKRIKDTGAAAVFTEPQYRPKVGQRIAKEAGVPVAALDPVASGPADPPGDYYEKVMSANLDTLRNILGRQQR